MKFTGKKRTTEKKTTIKEILNIEKTISKLLQELNEAETEQRMARREKKSFDEQAVRGIYGARESYFEAEERERKAAQKIDRISKKLRRANGIQERKQKVKRTFFTLLLSTAILLSGWGIHKKIEQNTQFYNNVATVVTEYNEEHGTDFIVRRGKGGDTGKEFYPEDMTADSALKLAKMKISNLLNKQRSENESPLTIDDITIFDSSTMTSSNSGITLYTVKAGDQIFTYYARSDGDELTIVENTMPDDLLNLVRKVTALYGNPKANARGTGTSSQERNSVTAVIELDQGDVQNH